MLQDRRTLQLPTFVIATLTAMVMQNPQLDSWDILDVGEAPLDLSTSNSSCIGLTRTTRDSTSSPDFPDEGYRENLETPVDEGYRVEDYIRYHVMEPMIPETMLSDESNDSLDVTEVLSGIVEDQREGPHKSYKKAIMRRYLDTDGTRKKSRHSPMKSNTTAAIITKATPNSGKVNSSSSSRRRSWDQISPTSNSPTNSIIYASEPYMTTHPVSHIGHRTAYSVSHPKTPVDTDCNRGVSYHSYMIPSTTAVTTTTSAPSNSSNSSCWSSWRQTSPRSSNNSLIQNSIFNMNETYVSYPTGHVSHPPNSNSPTYPTGHEGHLPEGNSPTHNSIYSNEETYSAGVLPAAHTRQLSRNNSPTPHNSMYNTSEAYIRHPEANLGHQPDNNNPRRNSIYNTSEAYTRHPETHVVHLTDNNSPKRNSILNNGEPYTIHPVTHLGQLHSNTSPTPNSMYNTNETYTILLPAAHNGQLTFYPTQQSKNLDVRRKYSNGADNNLGHLSKEYADLNLQYPTTSNSTTQTPTDGGYTLDRSPAIACEENNYEDLRTVSPQDLRIDIPEERVENSNGPLITESVNISNPPQANGRPEMEINLSEACLEAVLRKVSGVPNRPRWPKSWEFVMRLLVHEETNPSLVRWEDKSQYIFRLVQSNKVTHIWNTKSEKASHSYYNFARALRHHYKKQILIAVKEKQLVYKCGPKAIEYINELLQSTLRM